MSKRVSQNCNHNLRLAYQSYADLLKQLQFQQLDSLISDTAKLQEKILDVCDWTERFVNTCKGISGYNQYSKAISN